MKNKIMGLAVMIVSLFVGGVIALQLDPVLDLGILRIVRNGTTQFTISGNSSDQLEINQVGSATGVAVTVDDANGSIRLMSQPRVWFATAAATAAGYFAFDNTDNLLCVSTGTGGGAWIVVGATAAPSNFGVTGSENGNVKRCW